MAKLEETITRLEDLGYDEIIIDSYDDLIFYRRPETKEEIDRRRKKEAAIRKRKKQEKMKRLEAERKTYERLKKKFETGE